MFRKGIVGGMYMFRKCFYNDHEASPLRSHQSQTTASTFEALVEKIAKSHSSLGSTAVAVFAGKAEG